MIDYPYIIIVLILLMLTLMEGIYKSGIYYKISILVVLLFIGLRSPAVGADTWNYYHVFNGDQNYYNANDDREIEPLFGLYNYLLGILLLKSGFLYMIANTIFSLLFVKKLVDKYSQYKTLSVLLFFCVFEYLIYFIALRQILGFSILLYGIIYVLDNKKKKWIVYAICSIIGFLFHTSILLYAILMAGLYFIKINKSIYILILCLTIIVGFFLKTYNVTMLFDMYLSANLGMTDRLNGYMQDERWISDNSTPLLWALLPAIRGILICTFLTKIQINHWMVKIHLVSICLNNLLSDFTMLHRLNFPFSIFSIIVLTWVFPKDLLLSRIRLAKKIVFVLFVVLIVRRFVFSNMNADVQADGCMHPYIFFYEDYTRHHGYIVGKR